MNPLILSSTIKKPNDIKLIMLQHINAKTSSKRSGHGKNVQVVHYYDVVSSFDIETSSYYKNDEKRAIMYIWQLDIHGETIVGRTWNEFIDTIDEIAKIMQTDTEKRFVIYVHNLAYEFGFLSQRFNWSSVFALKKRNVIKAVTDSGIEFRCSYALSTLALKHIPNQISDPKLKVEKMVGDLDYTKIRNALTVLDDKEMAYCINDVKIVTAYIYEKALQDGEIRNLSSYSGLYVRVMKQLMGYKLAS